MPGRYGGEVVGGPPGEFSRAGTDELDGRRSVPGEEIHQHLPPAFGTDSGELRPCRLFAAGRVGEPPDLTGGMNGVAGERSLTEDHVKGARFGRDAHVSSVSADVEHRDVAGSWRRRIYDAADAGVDAVSPDQEVSHGLGAVLEQRHDPIRCCLGIHESLAVLDAGATPDRLVAQCPVEVGPLEGLADGAVWQGTAVGNVAE